MAEEDINVLNYVVVCISEFASRYGMHVRDAYIYLSRNKGIEFLKEYLKKEFDFGKLTNQYTFHTEKALKYLGK
jgi:hypothetical protein